MINKADGGIDTLYLMRYTFIVIIMKEDFSKKSTHAQKWDEASPLASKAVDQRNP